MVALLPKLKLHGFNNLTKTLSFNIYDVCYAREAEQRQEYIQYIDEEYNAERLTAILKETAEIIGATVLNIARQDYDPEGASVTMLISEETSVPAGLTNAEAPGPLPTSLVAHLNTSHITVHTYPETHPDQGVSTFRADIDVSTCGTISPLKALNHLIHCFDSDIVVMDYRVRGFTRDVRGRKHFIDHDISSIQNFISKHTLARYECVDVNLPMESLYHTRMMLKDIELDNYLFAPRAGDLPEGERRDIEQRLHGEIREIYNGLNTGG